MRVGHLTLVAYETDVDEQSQRAIHKSPAETFLFKGAAYVKNASVKVLVFRKNQANS